MCPPLNIDEGGATGNRLLDALPAQDREAVRRVARPASVLIGEEVYRQGAEMRLAYFPNTSMYSIVVALRSGSRAEVATVGKEGFLGVPIFLGQEKSPYTAVTQIAGQVYQLPAATLRDLARSSAAFGQLLMRYTAYSLQYVNQTVACNASHSLEARTCRWLLTAQDRAGVGKLNLTHEFLAEMLGVARQSMTLVAGALQRAGLIKYSRGDITILDRERLKACTCECYSETQRFYSETVSTERPSP
jgi:CRP-like cAMP-binding protein